MKLTRATSTFDMFRANEPVASEKFTAESLIESMTKLYFVSEYKDKKEGSTYLVVHDGGYMIVRNPYRPIG